MSREDTQESEGDKINMSMRLRQHQKGATWNGAEQDRGNGVEANGKQAKREQENE